MKTSHKSLRPQIMQSWIASILFAVAMGFLEAICVIYLRQLVFPAGFDIRQLTAPAERMPVEMIREACTLVILVSAAWMAGFNGRSRICYFFFIFGIWDSTYYIGLKWLAHWPSSWLGWDCLFLIPKPWFGPVLAPLGISLFFILASSFLLIKEKKESMIRFSFSTVLFEATALTLWFYSFIKDSTRITERGYSGVAYSWILFFLGLGFALLGLYLAERSRRFKSVP